MRLSESLRRNIMKTTIGGILNRFKVKSRRSTLFFEDILADYIKECENANRKDMRYVVKRCSVICTQQLTPNSLKKLPLTVYFNMIVKRVWVNIGLLKNLHVTRKNDIIMFKTENEAITRIIGKNHFMVELYRGALMSLLNSHIEIAKMSQTKDHCEYVFRIGNDFFSVRTKDKDLYNNLNSLTLNKGFTLKDALEKNIFQLKKNNRIYFRSKSLLPIENTFFHMLSNLGLLLNRIPYISYDYFSKIIEADTTRERKLILLKTILQIMGWGIVKILDKKKDEIVIEIHNPPYGFQLEKDNWDFIIKTILGYLWLLDKNFKIKEVKEYQKRLAIVYSK